MALTRKTLTRDLIHETMFGRIRVSAYARRQPTLSARFQSFFSCKRYNM